MTTHHINKKQGNGQCMRILALLTANRRKWVPMVDLHKASGALAVHSRIADLRKRGCRIVNRMVPVPGKKFRQSQYRLERSAA